jgi:hypothetical protein
MQSTSSEHQDRPPNAHYHRGFSYFGPQSEVRHFRDSDKTIISQHFGGQAAQANGRMVIPANLSDFQKRNIGAMNTIIDLERKHDEKHKQERQERYSGKSNKSNLYNFQLEVVNEEDHNIVETVMNKESLPPNIHLSYNQKHIQSSTPEMKDIWSLASQHKTNKSQTLSQNSSLQNEYADEECKTDEQEAQPISEKEHRKQELKVGIARPTVNQTSTVVNHSLPSSPTEARQTEKSAISHFEEFEQIIIRVIDLVASRDHWRLMEFLSTAVLDLTQVYDERGYTLVHMACMNGDHQTLQVLLVMADRYWQILNKISKPQQQTLIQTWINSPSLPPQGAMMNPLPT